MRKYETLAIGLVGCGLIGEKRSRALGEGASLIGCCDLDIEKAQKLASAFGCKVYFDWKDLVFDDNIDVVIIATLHDSLASITLAAIQQGKHVLVEKPAARNSAELDSVIAAAHDAEVKVHVGFNHRYHRSIRKAKELVDTGALGELMFLRARYGHGGRLGYEKEWRADPALSGGGELIDQGPHLIDLSRWFLGDITEVSGFAHNYFWKMPVDDNGFMLLKTAQKQVAFLHVSCTEWKNTFSLELYGKKGKLDLSGLGGSYGVEKLTWYKMLPEMGPPETITWEYPMVDDSWGVELNDFFEDIRADRAPSSGLVDAQRALRVIETVYEESGYDYCA